MADLPQEIIIDCQVFQTRAWHRGMGKYSKELLKALLENKTLHSTKVTVVMNSRIPVPADVSEVIKGLPRKVEVKLLPLETDKDIEGAGKFQKRNKQILNEAFAGHNPDETVFLIMALYTDEVVCTFPDTTRKALLFYDIIPFLYPERYSQFKGYYDKAYFPRFQILFEADIVYTISETVANDLNIYLGLDPAKLVNIDGAPISRVKLKESMPDGIPDPNLEYILMATGDELRKNNLRTVLAFERFKVSNPSVSHLRLVAHSHFEDKTKQLLHAYSPDIIFPGNVTEEEVAWLFRHAKVVLFASEYEGLGLPILEGMEFDKPIACSDIPVFKEISKTAMYFCDPMDVKSIADALGEAYHRVDWASKKSEYKAILESYAWPKTTDTFCAALEEDRVIEPASTSKKPRLAVLAPNPAGFSAIGKVVSETHPSLSQYFDVDYYFDAGPDHIKTFRLNYLGVLANCYQAKSFNRQAYKNYDYTLYHMGNSDYHINILLCALAYPGFAILHDTNLEGLYGWLEKTNVMPKKRIEAERLVNELNKTRQSNCLTSLVNDQQGIIVHSDYAKKSVEQILDVDVPIERLNLPTSVSKFSSQDSDHPRIRVGLAGILANIKGLEAIEEIALMPKFAGVDFCVFGFDIGKSEILQRIDKLEHVKVIANPTDFEFQTQLSRLDILVNYRMSYQGETSLTVLEGMRYGVVAMVRNVGWYNELPDGTVVKVKSLDNLVDALSELVKDGRMRKEIGAAGQRYIAENYTHLQYVKGLQRLFERATGRKNLNVKLAEMIKGNASLAALRGTVTKSS